MNARLVAITISAFHVSIAVAPVPYYRPTTTLSFRSASSATVTHYSSKRVSFAPFVKTGLMSPVITALQLQTRSFGTAESVILATGRTVSAVSVVVGAATILFVFLPTIDRPVASPLWYVAPLLVKLLARLQIQSPTVCVGCMRANTSFIPTAPNAISARLSFRRTKHGSTAECVPMVS